jgi:hypothetical protein
VSEPNITPIGMKADNEALAAVNSQLALQVTALESEAEGLRKLLKPIADWQAYMDEIVHYAPDSSHVSYPTTAGELRKIVQALAGKGGARE